MTWLCFLALVLIPGLALAPGTTAPAADAPPPLVETVATGLEIPWGLAFSPDGRVFVTERPGRVRVIVGDRLLAVPYLTLHDVDHGSESGLLGLALHPQFPRRPWLYLYYTHRFGHIVQNRVVRVEERWGRAWAARIVVDRIPSWVYHDGGRIAFGPDGHLYIGTGYGAWPITSQRLDSLGGKILRVNDDGAIPADNPFPGSAIYSYGHRNVQGLAWHPVTGRLYATEHGPTGEEGRCCYDEVNLIEAGKNYGWPHVVGAAGDPRFVDPVATSGPAESWAPSGATFVHGEPWRHSLLIAALRGRHLRRLVFDDAGRRVLGHQTLFRWQFGRLRDVVAGPDGALYVLTSNRDGRGMPVAGDDRVLRIRPAPAEGRTGR